MSPPASGLRSMKREKAVWKMQKGKVAYFTLLLRNVY
jgi:hypothetical protein